MKIFKSFNSLNKEINFIENIGFVPTMGSLHEGHFSLIKAAKSKSKKILVSIFINPTQFNDNKDYREYPKDIKKDILILKKLSVDYLFLPSKKEIYKKGIKQKINLLKKDKVLCAKYRIGHFEGVLAVVKRLLEKINSKYMFLGEKDFQQIYLIKKYLINRLNTKIISCKTIRNKNLLPLSSRNILLKKKSLKRCEQISKILFNFRRSIIKNFKNINLLNYYKSKILILCDKVEYLEIRNKNNLSKKINKKNFRIFVAYKQNKIRLIDNI